VYFSTDQRINETGVRSQLLFFVGIINKQRDLFRIVSRATISLKFWHSQKNALVDILESKVLLILAVNFFPVFSRFLK